MNNVTIFAAPEAEALIPLSLTDLFKEAERYGSIGIFTSPESVPPKCYRVSINFETSPGIQLSAASDFRMEIHEAMIMAISRAKIVAGERGK